MPKPLIVIMDKKTRYKYYGKYYGGGWGVTVSLYMQLITAGPSLHNDQLGRIKTVPQRSVKRGSGTGKSVHQTSKNVRPQQPRPDLST